MKTIRFFILFLFCFSTVYSQKVTLEWDNSKEFDYGSYKKNLPFFKNGNYSVINGSPFFTFTQKDKEFLLEFSKYNHTAPYFMDDSLRTNKKFLLDLIKVNYKTLLLLNLDYILGLKDENN